MKTGKGARRRLPARETYARIRDYERPETPCKIDLGDNTNLWGPHPAVRRALASLSDEDLTRYPSVYSRALVEALAKRNGVAPECVVTGCGSDDLLDSALRALSGPDKTLGFHDPTFTMIETFGWMNGLEAVDLTRTEQRPGVLYLCRPNNPTGDCLPASEVERYLKRPETPWVLLDEAYVEFGADTLVSWVERYPNLVVFRTLSKLYGLAGARIGYCIADPEVATEIRKSRGPYKVSRLAEKLALAAVEDGSGWVDAVSREVTENRQRLLARLAALGMPALPSEANFVLLPLSGSLRAREVAARAERLGVRFRPFSDLPGVGEALRVTIGPWEQMERAIEVLRVVTRWRPRIALLDYGAGNLRSIARGLEASGANVVVENSVLAAIEADAIVLPGVGSFGAVSRHFDAEPESREKLRESLSRGLPCLGVCLGMQFLFEESSESHGSGVGWFPGTVRPLEAATVPHMGWAEVRWKEGAAPAETGPRPCYYFAHGFHCVPEEDGREADGGDGGALRRIDSEGASVNGTGQERAVAYIELEGRKILAGFSRGRTLGVQFHPEKSGEDGLALLRAFVGGVRNAARPEALVDLTDTSDRDPIPAAPVDTEVAP